MISILQKVLMLNETMRKDGATWCSSEKAVSMAAAAFTLRPTLCVEIGVWGGGSLFPVAMVLKELGGERKVWAIDPWNPNASGEGYTGENLEWWTTKANHEWAHNYFQKILNETGTFQFVKVVRGKSDNVVAPDKIDFLHIDGQHTDQAVRDADRFAGKVRVGGMCVLDDLGAFDGHVDRAANRLRGLGFVELYRIGDAATGQSGFYQRT
jgi:hypothetical protein